jgi:hypothetical protein
MVEYRGSDPEGAAAWQADRNTEAKPLPYAGETRYPHDVAKNVDLAAAERSNVAKAAGEMGATSDEYMAARHALGHSPNAREMAAWQQQQQPGPDRR